MTEAPPPRLTFLTNIPNPYNGHLYRSLRELGCPTDVVYKGDPASEGRPWTIAVDPPDRIATGTWDERTDLVRRRPPGSTVVLCGSWATPRDARRRIGTALAPGPTRTVTWGERMSDRHGLRRALRRLYYSAPGLDAILAIGSWAVPSYRAASGGRVPIHVFPYTTDDGLTVEPRRSLRPTVGFSGRLIPEKGPDVLIRALGELAPGDRPDLDVVGSGPLGPDLVALADRLGVEATFHGEVSPDVLSGLRRRWWSSVTPSQMIDGWVDGWGLVVPESLNSGVPVVASGHVGAAHDLLRPGLDGTVVHAASADDPSAWAEAIGGALAQDLDEVSGHAREVGRAFAAGPAARWLSALLAGDLRTERSFVDDTWATLGDPAV